MDKAVIEIDGAMGEGGGQVLRSSLALSVLTQTPFRIHRIRANRSKDGLLRQHLTALRAAASISGAEVRGDALRSTEVTFRPGAVRPGEYRFAVGSAGSANLVLQTVLLPLLLAGGPSEVVLQGGTHNPTSPPFPFLEQAFLPLLARMGAQVDLQLERHGFYPAGGGRMRATIMPTPALQPLVLERRGSEVRTDVTAIVAHLKPQIAQRELGAAGEALDLSRRHQHVQFVDSDGPGNAIYAACETTELTTVFTVFGKRGVPAERVGKALGEQVVAWRDHGAPVDEHLADQLLLPIALAGRGSFVTGPPSLHTTTNIDVIDRFLGRRFSLREHGSTQVRIALDS